MKLKHYLSDDIEKFRNIKLGLVKDSNESKNVSKIIEDYKLSDEILAERDRLNIELKKIYTGKFKFDFCLLEDINIQRLKLKQAEKRKQIFEEYIKTNDVLGKTQTELEDKLSKNEDKE